MLIKSMPLCSEKKTKKIIQVKGASNRFNDVTIFRVHKTFEKHNKQKKSKMNKNHRFYGIL